MYRKELSKHKTSIEDIEKKWNMYCVWFGCNLPELPLVFVLLLGTNSEICKVFVFLLFLKKNIGEFLQ